MNDENPKIESESPEIITILGRRCLVVDKDLIVLPGGGEGEDDDPPTPEPAAPAVDPRDTELASIRASLAAKDVELAELRGGYNVLKAQEVRGGAPAPQTRTEPDVSEDDIEAAWEAGDNKKAARLSRKMAEQIADRKVAALRSEHVDPLVNQIGNYGLPAISGQAASLARMALDEEDRGYYDRFKAEIDQQLSQTNPEFRLVPENIRAVFDYVMGKHRRELQAERDEATLRKGTAEPQVTPGRTRGREQPQGKIPAPEDIFNDDMLSLLQKQGGADRYAQIHGYKDWADRCTKLGLTTVRGGNA